MHGGRCMTNDFAYLALIQLHISMLSEAEQLKVERLVDELQRVIDAYGDPEISPIAVTVICARNLIEMTSGGEV